MAAVNPVLHMLERKMFREFWKTYWPALLLLVLGVAYRLYLTPQYYGWEESDYGNLAMARGVLESGFRDFDMRHLPLYYFLSAVVLAFVDDTIVATHLVSLVAGALSIVFAYMIARKAFDEWTARVTGLLLCFQTEWSLYSASSLREPLYTLLVLLGCHALLRSHYGTSAVATGLSFLTRFDTLATNMPVTLLHLARRPGRLFRLRNPIWGVGAIYVFFVAAWSVYCGRYHGTYLFFMPTIDVNIETGGARELNGMLEFFGNGLSVVADLFVRTLPYHLGVIVWLASLIGMIFHRRQLFSRSPVGVIFSYLSINTLFWLAIGFVGQHEYVHNLYWKWLYVLVPFWVIFCADTCVSLLRRLATRPVVLSVAGILLSVGIAYGFHVQTAMQLEMSRTLYRPQVELAQWVEARVPPGTTMIFDNIPACYINRKPHSWHFISWFDVEARPGDLQSLAEFIRREKVQYVLWFKEDWTQAPVIAPYLAEPVPTRLDGFNLVPLFHEEQYGFIFFEVKRALPDIGG